MTTRAHWESRYQAKAGESLRPPSLFLQEQLHRLPRGRALDVACGSGRHALFLARHDFRVDGIDIALAGLRTAMSLARRDELPVRLVQADLERLSLPERIYDVVVNIRFLHRPLVPALQRTLRVGGMIVFETFLVAQREFGHPSDPAHLLEPGELRHWFHSFEILAYEERCVESESGPAHLARLLARRPTSWEPD